MPDLTIWISGADFIEMGVFLAEETIFRAIFAVTNLQQKLHY